MRKRICCLFWWHWKIEHWDLEFINYSSDPSIQYAIILVLLSGTGWCMLLNKITSSEAAQSGLRYTLNSQSFTLSAFCTCVNCNQSIYTKGDFGTMHWWKSRKGVQPMAHCFCASVSCVSSRSPAGAPPEHALRLILDWIWHTARVLCARGVLCARRPVLAHINNNKREKAAVCICFLFGYI